MLNIQKSFYHEDDEDREDDEDDEYRESIKEVKTQQVVAKHRRRQQGKK